MPEPKMKKCRFCGKDCEIGKPCAACAFDEDKEREAARIRKVRAELDKEIAEESSKDEKKDKRNIFGY